MIRYAVFLSLLLLAGCATPREYLSEWEHVADLANRVDTTAHEVQKPQLIGPLSQIVDILGTLDAHERCPVEGEVIVGFIVDETGGVSETQVHRGLRAGCNAVSEYAVRDLRFQPARMDGRPAKMMMIMPIRFGQTHRTMDGYLTQ